MVRTCRSLSNSSKQKASTILEFPSVDSTMRKYPDETFPPLKGKLDKHIEETKAKWVMADMLKSMEEIDGLGSRQKSRRCRCFCASCPAPQSVLVGAVPSCYSKPILKS